MRTPVVRAANQSGALNSELRDGIEKGDSLLIGFVGLQRAGCHFLTDGSDAQGAASGTCKGHD
jgi:hypothetical protein